MLYPHNEYLLRYVVKETTARYLREAEIDHLLDEINPHPPSRLTYQIRKALHGLGHWLVAIGRRLDHTETSPT